MVSSEGAWKSSISALTNTVHVKSVSGLFKSWSFDEQCQKGTVTASTVQSRAECEVSRAYVSASRSSANTGKQAWIILVYLLVVSWINDE